jgi:hypothetical protein
MQSIRRRPPRLPWVKYICAPCAGGRGRYSNEPRQQYNNQQQQAPESLPQDVQALAVLERHSKVGMRRWSHAAPEVAAQVEKAAAFKDVNANCRSYMRIVQRD